MSLKMIPLSGGSYPQIGIPMLPNSLVEGVLLAMRWRQEDMVFEKRREIGHLCID
jgi:hypothetical protein